jgi:5-oxoprolinase (ATP-hydrolysing)
MSASAGGPRRGFRFGIDRGGTFTDVYCELPSGKIRVLKLLSEDPANYPDAPREGIRRILQEETGKPHPRDSPVDTSQIESIRMGTTVATNALLERKGERCALVTTAGFKDLLRIGNQSRPRIFDLEICRPDLLYEAVVEVKERIALDRDGEGGIEDQAGVDVGVTGEKVRVISPPDLLEARRCLQKVLDAGITSIAVVFLHSYLYPRHEEMVGDLAKQMGFSHVSLSSEVMPMVRMVPRGYTTAADAYLTPIVRRYISSFASGFDQDFSKVRVLFMQSDGGLTPVESFRGSRAILSGPAGGVVGTAVTAGQAVSSPEPGAKPQPIMALDMGGTVSISHMSCLSVLPCLPPSHALLTCITALHPVSLLM